MVPTWVSTTSVHCFWGRVTDRRMSSSVLLAVGYSKFKEWPIACSRALLLGLTSTVLGSLFLTECQKEKEGCTDMHKLFDCSFSLDTQPSTKGGVKSMMCICLQTQCMRSVVALSARVQNICCAVCSAPLLATDLYGTGLTSHTAFWGFWLQLRGSLQPYFTALYTIFDLFNRLSAVASSATVGTQHFYWFWDFGFCLLGVETISWCDRYFLNLWTYFWAALSHIKYNGKDNSDSPLHDGGRSSM